MHNGILRETFTQNITKELLEGYSLNVYSAPGQGLSRFVQDIANCAKAAAKVVRINMKSYTQSYEGFVQDLAGQLKLERKEMQQMETLISHYLLENQQKTLLLFENFDALFAPGIDAQYDASFVNYLNSLRNKDNVGLLLTTRAPVSREAIYFGNKLGSGSMIDLHEREELPRLTMPQIETELKHYATANKALQTYFNQYPSHLNVCVASIYNHSQPYEFLSYLHAKLENLTVTNDITQTERQLNKWKRDFNKSDRAVIGKRISKWKKLVNYINFHTNELFGTYTVLQSVKAKWVLIGTSVIGLGYTLYKYWEKIAAWFN